MKITFWLLDLNYEAQEDVPEIWLWGIAHDGRRVLVIDRGFAPYFYAVVKEGFDSARVAEAIRRAQPESVIKLETAERKYLGKPVEVMKVYCRNPDLISKCAKEVRKFEGVEECLEEDIRYSTQYLIDNKVVPCGWHEADVSEEENPQETEIDNVYSAKTAPKPIEKNEVPKLKILGLSTICYSREGSPRPETNPVVAISTITSQDEEKQFQATDKNDRHVLEEFVNYVRKSNPDIIIGYGVNTQDWPYLLERCRKLGLHLYVDRTKTEPHRSVYGHISITGRANLDLADYAEEFQEVKVKTLRNLAEFLGVMKNESRTVIEEAEFADYWDDKQKREALLKFSMDNARCVIGVADAILNFALQLSNLVGLPLDYVGTAAVGFRVEAFLMKHAHEIGELIPKRIERPYHPYAGGIVLDPEPGLHENIASLDFKSMYPNIMINYNLSPDTYVSPEERVPPNTVYEAPEVKHRFRKDPPGFYKEAISYMLKARNEIRSKMKETSPKSSDNRVLDARQKAVKVITNALYGYAGWIAARWYIKPVAEAATAWGRYTILTAIKMAKDFELKVIYGDTDSIFTSNETKKILKLSKEIESKLGLEIKPDKTYVRIFFTEAKKRYAGLLPDGHLDIVGLEVIRGDWAGIAKTVQERVLTIILKEQSPKKATQFVKQTIRDLRQKRIPFKDLTIWKTLTRPVNQYEVRASHVEAAKMLQEKGWKLTVGDKVGYVVVNGSGRLYERVKPYMFVSYDDIDLEYYVLKQIAPAAARVLASFGITEEDLLKDGIGEKETRSLTDYF